MDEYSVSVSLPLDNDGFLRRECPTCERQFKWFSHSDGDQDAEHTDQYFCPLCGAPADTSQWWTPDQLTHAEATAGPEIERVLQDAFKDAFSGLKGIRFEPGDSGFDAPTIGVLVEPDDMVIVEPPCHPNEPIKVPNEAADHLVHCLICGSTFAA